VADFVRDAGRELFVGERSDEAARHQQPRPQHADQRHQRRVDVDFRNRDGGAGDCDRTGRLHPDARAPDGTSPRAHAAGDRRDEQRGRTKGQSRQCDVETLDEVARFVPPVRRHENDDDEEQSGRGR